MKCLISRLGNDIRSSLPPVEGAEPVKFRGHRFQSWSIEINERSLISLLVAVKERGDEDRGITLYLVKKGTAAYRRGFRIEIILNDEFDF